VCSARQSVLSSDQKISLNGQSECSLSWVQVDDYLLNILALSAVRVECRPMTQILRSAWYELMWQSTDHFSLRPKPRYTNTRSNTRYWGKVKHKTAWNRFELWFVKIQLWTSCSVFPAAAPQEEGECLITHCGPPVQPVAGAVAWVTRRFENIKCTMDWDDSVVDNPQVLRMLLSPSTCLVIQRQN